MYTQYGSEADQTPTQTDIYRSLNAQARKIVDDHALVFYSMVDGRVHVIFPIGMTTEPFASDSFYEQCKRAEATCDELWIDGWATDYHGLATHFSVRWIPVRPD